MSFNMLGEIFSTGGLGQYQYLATVVKFLNQAIIPFTITLTVAASVFAIVLAFMIMKAESADKATEMKKRLWGLIITVVIVIVAVWLLGWLLSNFNTIMTAIRSMGSGL